jgi:hypothetical protein
MFRGLLACTVGAGPAIDTGQPAEPVVTELQERYDMDELAAERW